MKWFKHYTNLLDSDDAQSILDRHGYAGIYAYMKMLERFASRFEPDTPGLFLENKRALFSTLFPICCHKTGKKILEFFQELKIINYKIKNKEIIVKCYIIEDLADEYTQKCLEGKK